LKKELDDLMKRAIAFNIISKSSDIKGYVGELETKFNELDTKRTFFKKELERLATIVKGED
jgi:hypothetical protein